MSREGAQFQAIKLTEDWIFIFSVIVQASFRACLILFLYSNPVEGKGNQSLLFLLDIQEPVFGAATHRHYYLVSLLGWLQRESFIEHKSFSGGVPTTCGLPLGYIYVGSFKKRLKNQMVIISVLSPTLNVFWQR